MVLLTVFFWIMVVLKATLMDLEKRTFDCKLNEGEVYGFLHYISCVAALCKLAEREESRYEAWYINNILKSEF
jgi:hypothetical protein